MHDLPRLAPSGTLIQGAPVPGSSIISWARGDHVKEMAKLRRARPDIILVVLGTNDVYMGPRVINNEPPYLAKLLRDLKKISKNIVWIGPPKLQARPAGFAKFKEMMLGVSSQEAKFVDSSAISIAFWGDKMHCARPDPDGCGKWAKWILSVTF